MYFKKILLLVATILLLATSPASADEVVKDFLGEIASGGSVPNFRFSKPQYVAVQVKAAGGSFWQWRLDEIGSWLETAVLSSLAKEGRLRNIKAIRGGQPEIGQLRLLVEVRAVSGEEIFRSSTSDRTRHSSSYQSNSSEKELVYLTIQSTLEKRVGKDSWEIVAAPDGRISTSESRQTAGSSARSFRIEHWRYSRGGWSRFESGDSSFSWSTSSEVAREQLLDDLTQLLSRQVVTLVFKEWWITESKDDWGAAIDKNRSSSPAPDNVRRALPLVVVLSDGKSGRAIVDPGPDRELKEGMILVPSGGSEASRLKVVALFPKPRDERASRYAICEPVEESGRKTTLPAVGDEYGILPL